MRRGNGHSQSYQRRITRAYAKKVKVCEGFETHSTYPRGSSSQIGEGSLKQPLYSATKEGSLCLRGKVLKWCPVVGSTRSVEGRLSGHGQQSSRD